MSCIKYLGANPWINPNTGLEDYRLYEHSWEYGGEVMTRLNESEELDKKTYDFYAGDAEYILKKRAQLKGS